MKTTLITALALVLLAASTTSLAEKHSPFIEDAKTHTVRASILALSTHVHQNWAGNNEVYLADIEIGGKGNHEFVKLVDLYAGFSSPIRPTLLQNRTLFKMRITRDTTCDTIANKIFLPATDTTIYDGSVRDTLTTHRDDLIPCYRIEHRSIKVIEKK